MAKKSTKAIKRSEFTEQCAIFSWAQYNEEEYPALKYINASLSGMYFPMNLAMQAKRSGMKKGVPDINLPYHNGTFSGLYIELKYGRNKASKEQLEWIEWLEQNKYYACVAYGAEEAVYIIQKYLKNELK